MPLSAAGGEYSLYNAPDSSYLGFGNNNTYNPLFSNGYTMNVMDPGQVAMTSSGIQNAQNQGNAAYAEQLYAMGLSYEQVQSILAGGQAFNSQLNPATSDLSLLGMDPTIASPVAQTDVSAGLSGLSGISPTNSTSQSGVSQFFSNLADFSPQGLVNAGSTLLGGSGNVLPLNGTGIPGLISRGIGGLGTSTVQNPGINQNLPTFDASNPFSNIGGSILTGNFGQYYGSDSNSLQNISDILYGSVDGPGAVSTYAPAAGLSGSYHSGGPTTGTLNSDGSPMTPGDYAAWQALATVQNPSGTPPNIQVAPPIVQNTPTATGNDSLFQGPTLDPFPVTDSRIYDPSFDPFANDTAGSGAGGGGGNFGSGGVDVTMPAFPVTASPIAPVSPTPTVEGGTLPPFNVTPDQPPAPPTPSPTPITPNPPPVPQPFIPPPIPEPTPYVPSPTPTPTVPTPQPTPTIPEPAPTNPTPSDPTTPVPTTTNTGDRNAYPEGLAQNYAQYMLSPQQLAEYQSYAPAYAAADAKSLGTYMFGQGGPSTLAGMSAALTTQGINQNPLLQMQNQVALQQLGLGGNLSASELRAVQQSSRAGFSARGLDATNASVVDETMQTDAAKRNRLLASLGIAQGVQTQNQAFTNSQNAYNTSMLGLGQNQNIASNAATRAQFDPFNNYGMDLANTNYNAGQARNIAANNNSTALGVAAMNQDAAAAASNKSLAGSIIGGFLGRCWVAREAFGVNSPKWLAFRDWLDTKAPQWFSDAYTQFGPEIADFLFNHPELKPTVRLRMEALISNSL